MTDTAKAPTEAANDPEAKTGSDKPSAARRDIPGNLLYTTTPGSLKSVLDQVQKAEVPEKFSKDFIAQILGIKGGSAAQQISTLKRMGLVAADGTPTERYSRFRSDMDRSAAALEALKAGYNAIFQKNTFAHTLSDSEIKDIVAQITGLKKNDAIVGYITGTFDRIKGYITDKNAGISSPRESENTESSQIMDSNGISQFNSASPIGGLNYVINITLPQSNNIDTYNMIFKSLRENILDWHR